MKIRAPALSAARGLCALALGLAGAGAAHAYPDRYSASVVDSFSTRSTQIDAVRATASLTSDAPFYQGRAAAGPTISGFTSVDTALTDPTPVPGNPPNPAVRVIAEAGIEYYDLQISGSGSALNSPLALFLDGTLSAWLTQRAGATVEASVFASSRIRLSVYVYGCPHVDCAAQQYVGERELGASRSFVSGAWTSSETRSGSGFLGGAPAWVSAAGSDSINAVIRTAPLTLPVNQPFSIAIGLLVLSEGGASYPFALEDLAWVAHSKADFENTLALPADVPLLDLPAGFRFDGPGAGIVNNLCVGAGCATVPVPEPAAGWLWLVGGAALAGAVRRRRAAATSPRA